jgi:hypothetical protein
MFWGMPLLGVKIGTKLPSKHDMFLVWVYSRVHATCASKLTLDRLKMNNTFMTCCWNNVREFCTYPLFTCLKIIIPYEGNLMRVKILGVYLNEALLILGQVGWK